MEGADAEMNNASQYAETDPRHHTVKILQHFDELIDQLRREVTEVDDARAKALFETSAEVIGGLSNAFRDFEEGTEAAWRR